MRVGIGIDSENARKSYTNLRNQFVKSGMKEDDASVLITTITKTIELTTTHCVSNMFIDLDVQLAALNDEHLKSTLKYQVKMSILLSLYGDLLQYRNKEYILELLDKTSGIKDSDVVTASDDD